MNAFGIYDHYLFAATALLGTFAACGGLLWLAHASRFAARISAWRGVSPPFVNVVGVLFALTLAFLANDTWSAHDRALSATLQEAGSLRNILSVGAAMPEPTAAAVRGAVAAYARAVVEDEWPLLSRRQESPQAGRALEQLLAFLSSHEVAAVVDTATHGALLQQAVQVQAQRDARLALSRTHVNPLKWLGMAFLGFLTMISIAMVYVDQLKAEIVAVGLFALAAAPTAAIVLVQGNPFQAPTAVSAAPFLGMAALP
ncbi:MAG: DUF4239 domain-containing protein [Actinomycetota bacterium]